MFGKSIRLRFQLWLAFLLVVVLSGFGFTAFQLYRTSELNQIDAQLERRVGALNVDIRGGPPGGPGGRRFGGFREHMLPPLDESFRKERSPMKRDGPPPDDFFKGPPPGFPPPDGEFRGRGMERREIRLSERTENLFDELDTNSFYFAAWSMNGNVLRKSTNAPANLERPARVGRETGVQISMNADRREAHQHTEIGETVLVGVPIREYHENSKKFAALLICAGTGVLLIGLSGGWALTTRALKPIQEISAAAAKISGGNLSQRIDVAETDSELGQLANLLNATFGRLDAAFAQQKQFTADAAHELRTPLAVLISETQTTLARPREAEEYRETVEACLETAQQMRKLTNSLLELARLDAGQEKINRAQFDLAGLARKIVDELSPLARERNIAISAELEATETNGDAERLGQVITNLVTNAINYGKENGKVRIATRKENGLSILTVADDGSGISEEHLPHIFERFYRADTSRSGGQGRSGLGLAISKAIVDAHNGSIGVSSKLGEGTTFIVRI